jgi:predicted HTH domain antitoxin
MHAVNVHQLKNNPSEALRKAKDAPVIVMKGDRPAALMLSLDDDTLLSQPDVRLALATELFKCGHLSLGRAARVANTPLVDFMKHLPREEFRLFKAPRVRLRKTLTRWTSGALRPERRRAADLFSSS